MLRQDNPPPEPIKDIEYDAKQRIRKLYTDGKLKAEYRYDTQNLRTKKILYNDETGAITEEVYYHYDTNGLLIGESDGTGQAKRDYIYLDGIPVGQIDVDNQSQESIVYLHTDHLATPRLATNQNQTIVWKWESDAYGAIPPQGSVTINLRYPGQYADQESGWFYNWNRYYDSERGRYWTSDPIGLKGGVNTYTYVGNNPLILTDFSGLTPCDLEVALEVAEKNLSGRPVPPPGKGKWRPPGSPEILPYSKIALLGTHPVTGLPPSAASRSFGNYWIDTKFHPRFGPCLSDDEAKDLFLTVIHEGTHWSDPPKAPYNDDDGGTGFAYDAEKVFGTDSLLNEYVQERQKCSCMCQ